MLRKLAIVSACLVLLLLAVVIAARFMDGPLGALAGGALRSGELVKEPIQDWDFIEDVEFVELQLLNPARSRTTWILEEDGRAYIPCGWPSNRLWKQWPHEAMEDGRALLRSDGKRYPVQLVRIDPSSDPKLASELAEELDEKYDLSPDSGYEVWYFRLDSRPG
jgi:hypothetical protein